MLYKQTIHLALFSFCICFSNLVIAHDVADALAICAKVENSIKRLVCFDELTKKQTENKSHIDSYSQTITESSKPKVDVAEQSTNEIDSFGKQLSSAEDETQLIDGELHSTVSKIIQKNNRRMRFVLTNGQIWEKVENGVVGLPKINDKVVIREESFGAFYMKKQGVKRSFKVKRLSE